MLHEFALILAKDASRLCILERITMKLYLLYNYFFVHLHEIASFDGYMLRVECRKEERKENTYFSLLEVRTMESINWRFLFHRVSMVNIQAMIPILG